MAGYMTGSVSWSLGYSGLLAYGRRFLTKRLFQAIYMICGLVLVLFAIMILLVVGQRLGLRDGCSRL